MLHFLSQGLRQANAYRKKDFKFDLVSAIVVFLVAIPLCLGIALASGAPLLSGFISGIIGGIVVGMLSGSHVSVSGPAAGMAAVVLGAISYLGDFNTFLTALVLAGVIQMLVGIARGGFIAEYIPSNVVQGLLCAIGLLLIIKQLPLAFTHPMEYVKLKVDLVEATKGVKLKPLQDILSHIDMGAILISLVSFAVLIFFDVTKNKTLKNIPAPILVVLAGVVMNEAFIFYDSSLTQDVLQMVQIPEHQSLGAMLGHLQFPNWSALYDKKVYLYAFIIMSVASLETLLNIKAAESLDKRKRHCSKDRELVAQGAGNIVVGLIGGIPITSVIVRTSVNVESGSRTKFSTILHGFFLLAAIMLLPKWINKIPLTSLAAILIHTGYKLNRPTIYKNFYAQGLDRFIPFIATIVGILIFNLLSGVLIGLAFSFFNILRSNSRQRIDLIQEIYPTGVVNRLMLPRQVSFLNKASLFAELDTVPKDSQFVIDASNTEYMDKDIIDLINNFQREAKQKNISASLVGFKDHYDVHDSIHFINVTTYDVQSNIRPEAVLNILQEGNERFVNDTRIHRIHKLDIEQTAETQHPLAVIVTCIDSRVPVETIFDMTVGDIFVARVAGNIANPDILASIEYACEVVGAKLVVVLGHTRCGAISAACDSVELGHITQLLEKVKPAIEAENTTMDDRNSKNAHFVHNVTELNIANSMRTVYQDSEILKNLIDKGEVGLIGASYDVQTGKVRFGRYSEKLHALPQNTPEGLVEKLQTLEQRIEQPA